MSKAARPARPRRNAKGPHVYERGGWQWIYLPAEGDQPDIRKSAGTRDAREAHRKLAEILGGRRDPGEAARGEAREERLAVIMDHYTAAPHGWKDRTAASVEQRAGAFVIWCEARKISTPSQITGDHVQQWFKDRLASGATHATVNRDLVVVRKMLRWGADEDRKLCALTPFERAKQLREAKREAAPIIPSPVEIGRVVRVITERGHERPPVARGAGEKPRERTRVDRAIDPKPEARMAALYVACSLATGARISEIADVAAVQIHKGAWVIPPGKGHAERTLPLSPESERAFRELAALRGTVRSRNGQPAAMNDHWALALIAWGCEVAGVERFTPHDLRRTFATECRRAGLPVTHIRDLMGHKDTQTTERYFGRYRSDAEVAIPVPLALRDLVMDAPANVVPMRRGKR